jgi:prophage regulatory protein
MSAVVNLDSRRVGAAAVIDTPAQADRILRLKTVADRSGLSRSTIYRRIPKGEFPAPVSLGGTSVGWRESAINTWIASRDAAGVA